MKGIIIALLFLLVATCGQAFVVVTSATRSLSARSGVPGATSTTPTPTTTSTSLFVNKNKTNNKKNSVPSEKIQITNPVELLLIYMTPWKNPNSIFVYLFALLYILGTISEARPAAGQ